MSDKALASLLKAVFALVLLLGAAGVWYFTLGKKPEPAPSGPVVGAAGVGAAAVAPVAGGKATPDPRADAAAKSPAVVAAATPAPGAPVVAKAVADEAPALRKLPELSTDEKADQLIAKRTERRFAKLREWSAKLNAKKATLKTPLQIEAFNEEARKYHAELAEARAEAAAAQK